VIDAVNPLGTAINLRAAAEDLRKDYPRAASLINRLASAHSIRSDLGMALDMMTAHELVLPLARSGTDANRWAADSALALINSAVIFYVRATHSSSNHRGTIDFRNEYSEKEREVHQTLTKLRNDAIAHFGPGEEYGGPPWQAEGVFLPIDRPDDIRIMTASRRIIMQKQLQDRMSVQISRAILIAEKATQTRNSELARYMNDLVEDRAFVSVIEKHRMDLVEFFETEEARDHALSGLRSRRLTGVVDHSTREGNAQP